MEAGLNQENYFVVTGGPGSGKTSTIEALRKRGVCCVSESGRDIIREQISIGGSGLPWLDTGLFRELMLSSDLQNYQAYLDRAGAVVFDRGVVDVLGYSRLTGLAADQHVVSACVLYRYNRQVFIAPPWRSIYVTDGERKQTFQEAVSTYDAMLKAYQDSGYTLTELHCVSPMERADQIIEMLPS